MYLLCFRGVIYNVSVASVSGQGIPLTLTLYVHRAAHISEKRFYNRETNTAAFCVIRECPSNTLLFYTTKIIKHFLIQSSRPIMKKGRNFSLWWYPYNPYCFSSLESLLISGGYIFNVFGMSKTQPQILPVTSNWCYHWCNIKEREKRD